MPQEIDVLVSEVGPRDGLQSIERIMPTEIKILWIKALAASGLREIEVGSFVSPRLMPQMADCATLVREANKLENLNVQALVPNLKGAELAIAAGARKLTMPISASRSIASVILARPRKKQLKRSTEYVPYVTLRLLSGVPLSRLVSQLPSAVHWRVPFRKIG